MNKNTFTVESAEGNVAQRYYQDLAVMFIFGQHNGIAVDMHLFSEAAKDEVKYELQHETEGTIWESATLDRPEYIHPMWEKEEVYGILEQLKHHNVTVEEV